MADSCARRSRAAATNFIARVICWVFFTERMRRRKSRSVAMFAGQWLLLFRRSGLKLGRETLFERIERGLDTAPDSIVESFLFGNVLKDLGVVGFDELQELTLKAADFADRDGVQKTAGGDV